jgi:uncharacterized membrane protein YeaQ/YmgE (transglycosylase-associated protein family)
MELKMQQHNQDGSVVSLAIGFILAFTNHLFGWLGNIQITAHWDGWFQAVILGIIGSTVTFFTNRFWKYMEKKYKSRKD